MLLDQIYASHHVHRWSQSDNYRLAVLIFVFSVYNTGTSLGIGAFCFISKLNAEDQLRGRGAFVSPKVDQLSYIFNSAPSRPSHPLLSVRVDPRTTTAIPAAYNDENFDSL